MFFMSFIHKLNTNFTLHEKTKSVIIILNSGRERLQQSQRRQIDNVSLTLAQNNGDVYKRQIQGVSLTIRL